MVPVERSRRWLSIFGIYAIVVFVAFLLTRALLGSEIFIRYILVMMILSIVTAVIPSIAGYYGKRTFFSIMAAATTVGIVYMFYVVLGNTEPGWGDLSSIVGFLLIVGVGAGLGLAAEAGIYLMRRDTHRKEL
jgi:hypothetical protein